MSVRRVMGGSSRVIGVSLLALLFLLPGLAGVHDHILSGSTHDQLEDVALQDVTLKGGNASLWERALAWFDPGHHIAHEHLGEVDVDPPAKAFSKSPSGKPLLAAAIVATLLLVLTPVVFQVLGAAPPLRPPAHRTRPYLFPPSQAPPRAR
jgi:hypothetical protein